MKIDKYIEILGKLVEIPSISSVDSHKDDVVYSANFVKELFEDLGLEGKVVSVENGQPAVLAKTLLDSKKKTVLLYAHHDVQPVGDESAWNTNPFTPTISGGRLYGRGSGDDKAGIVLHYGVIEQLIQSLPVNIKVFIEGEEEIGSDNLEVFVKENKTLLKADIILVSDTAIIANDTPSITTGLRGLSYVEVEVTGPNKDLHSGVYGGAVGNPINILSKMITSLFDENNRITIPGFYDDVIDLSDAERKEMAKAPFDLEVYKKELKVDDVYGETGYSTSERASIRPTLDVNGIWGGYIGEGAKTVLPSKAYAKISMRLVPNQTPDKITKLFKQHFESIAPKAVKVKVTPHHGGFPAVVPTDFPAYQAASKAMEESFGKKPIPTRGGGSIPIVALFEKELGLKTILMGFGLNSDDIHSPNEHYGVFNYFKGIETIPLFFKYFSELK